MLTIGILSDIHYAAAGEQARGEDYEFRCIRNPAVRLLAKSFRHFVWLRHPLGQNHLLDETIVHLSTANYVIANGDYACDSAYLGVSDDAGFESARECLGKLRGAIGDRFRATIGDHELGKLSLVGRRGGMRVASYHRARQELGLQSCWRLDIGRYALVGVTSSLVALPVFEPDTLPAERPEWERLRREHLAEIRAIFEAIPSDRRILLFCHDPTALPFLGREEAVRARLPQIEQTVVGHLHSRLILWKSRRLAGMPALRFLGPTVLRMSTALREAWHWKPFHVRLCPSLAGLELLKDGGFLTARIDEDGRSPARFEWHRLPR